MRIVVKTMAGLAGVALAFATAAGPVGAVSSTCFGPEMAASTQSINQYYKYFASTGMQPGSWGAGDVAGPGQDQVWGGISAWAYEANYTGDPIGLAGEVAFLKQDCS